MNLLKSLIRKLIFKLNNNTVLVNGKRIYVHKDLSNYFNIIKNNIVESDLFYLILKLLNKGDFFIDIGSNIGIIGMMASEKIGRSGYVILIEPNPYILNYLTANLKFNCKFPNYSIIQAAISNKSCIDIFGMNLSDSILMEQSSLIYKSNNTEEIQVLCISIDQIIPSDKTPDVIKIDIEGAELLALKGAKKTIERCRPIICVEIHGLYFNDPWTHVKQVFDFFYTLNYEALNLLKGEVESVDKFMEDSGMFTFDNISGKSSNTVGYGNIIFVPDHDRLQNVMKIIKSAKSNLK